MSYYIANIICTFCHSAFILRNIYMVLCISNSSLKYFMDTPIYLFFCWWTFTSFTSSLFLHMTLLSFLVQIYYNIYGRASLGFIPTCGLMGICVFSSLGDQIAPQSGCTSSGYESTIFPTSLPTLHMMSFLFWSIWWV